MVKYFSIFFLALCFVMPVKAEPQHAIALHGTAKYPADFEHLEYVNPDAPKGGVLKLSTIGTFDSLNPFIVKGEPAAGLNYLRSGLVFESLMQNSWDEPFTLYGVLAESIDVADDKSWVRFVLRDEAVFADGKPVTAADVKWTFETLREHGQPFFKAYWHDVSNVIVEGDKQIKFEFAISNNAELPLIVAEMVVLPKHFWDGKEFTSGSLEKPLGSGPYEVGTVNNGRSIEYVRRDDWWGKDLAFFKGFNNFERVQYDYYRDDNVALEAFFAGEYDVRMENIAKLWEQAYDAPAVKDGRIIKAEIENERPAGMQAFVYNVRRPLFQDKALRKALSYAFDFEWSNKQFAYGSYVRTDSYFENSELASVGLPQGDELALLETYRGRIPDEVFTKSYAPPKTDGSGNARKNLRKAAKILDEAGWVLGPDKIRVKDGQRLEFEILYFSQTYERWVLPFIKNLQRIGVKANFRVVDPAQYQNRMNAFDFDVTVGGFGQSGSPGNEQRDFWGAAKAEIQGSRNYIGVQDPVVDEIIDLLIQAKSRDDLVTKVRALDRILLWNHYVIPMWHYNKWRIAHSSDIERPDTLSGISPLISQTWWHKDAAVKAP